MLLVIARVAVASFVVLSVQAVHAQTYPSRPIRILVPLAPGGGMDGIARGVAQNLTDSVGQTVVVDNRPGAGSQLALQILANGAPDGHTLMMMSANTVIHPLLYPDQSRFDIVRDFAPVSQVTAQGFALVVHPSLPAKTTAEFVKYAKANPGKLNYASSGIGSPNHMTTELFQIATGTQLNHIPYTGMGAAYADLISGRLSLSFAAVNGAQQHVSAGRLRMLAVTPGKRMPAVPDIPTLKEGGVAVEVVNWYGLIAPKGVSKAVTERIAAEVTKSVRSPEMTKRLVGDGSDGVGSTPAEFSTHIRAEYAMWGKVIKQAGIRGQ